MCACDDQGYPSSEDELKAPKTAIKIIHMGKILRCHAILDVASSLRTPASGLTRGELRR